MLEVDFQAGEMRSSRFDGNYMLVKVESNGEEYELYAEYPFEDADKTMDEWDEESYPVLKAEIIRQAEKIGYPVENLKFFWN